MEEAAKKAEEQARRAKEVAKKPENRDRCWLILVVLQA